MCHAAIDFRSECRLCVRVRPERKYTKSTENEYKKEKERNAIQVEMKTELYLHILKQTATRKTNKFQQHLAPNTRLCPLAG